MGKRDVELLCAMDRTGTTYVEAPVNRDSVLQLILILLFLQRSGGSILEENPAAFSFSPNEDLQIRGFPSSIECSTTSGFS